MTAFRSDQLAVAQDIVNVALARGLGVLGADIGVMVGMAESDLTNVDHGDAPGPSSRGVFQQMPGWGSLACRMDPTCASGLFYDRLEATPWQAVPPWVAAQRIQESEFVQGFSGEGSDGTEGWNYLQRHAAAVDLVTQLVTNPPIPPPTGGPTVTPEQYATLVNGIAALQSDLGKARADLDTLIHAQVAMEINQVLPYLQKIANHLGV